MPKTNERDMRTETRHSQCPFCSPGFSGRQTLYDDGEFCMEILPLNQELAVRYHGKESFFPVRFCPKCGRNLASPWVPRDEEKGCSLFEMRNNER